MVTVSLGLCLFLVTTLVCSIVTSSRDRKYTLLDLVGFTTTVLVWVFVLLTILFHTFLDFSITVRT